MMDEHPAVQALARAGWVPTRSVDIEVDLQTLAKDGYSTFPAAVEFLRQYSGLQLPIVDRLGRPDEIWFSAHRACMGIASSWIRTYSDRSGTTVLPVGEAYHGHLTLLIGENGHWFGGYDNEFGLIGEDLLSCLDNLISNAQFIRRL
jgi:hypothetical protein